jgi:hypothetical protein
MVKQSSVEGKSGVIAGSPCGIAQFKKKRLNLELTPLKRELIKPVISR